MIEVSDQQRTALRLLLSAPTTAITVAKACRIKVHSALVMLAALRSRGLVVQRGRFGPSSLWQLTDIGRSSLNAGAAT